MVLIFWPGGLVFLGWECPLQGSHTSLLLRYPRSHLHRVTLGHPYLLLFRQNSHRRLDQEELLEQLWVGSLHRGEDLRY